MRNEITNFKQCFQNYPVVGCNGVSLHVRFRPPRFGALLEYRRLHLGSKLQKQLVVHLIVRSKLFTSNPTGKDQLHIHLGFNRTVLVCFAILVFGS